MSWLRVAPGALLALTSAACSLLISGEDQPLTCTEEGQQGPPACDEGFVCFGGICAQKGRGEAATGGDSSRAPELEAGASGTAGENGAKRDSRGSGGLGGAADP